MSTTIPITAATIEVPASLTAAVAAERGTAALPRWGLEALVAEGVREGLLTARDAGEILDLGYFQTEAFLKEKGVPAAYTQEDLEQDLADMRRVSAALDGR